MTELAYLADISEAYVRTFRARVVALPPGGVVLDRTYFYPTGGGQPADRGRLGLVEGNGGLEVVDVNKSGASVIHRVKGAPAALGLRAGVELEGTLDWERRHRHMRLHTGQHLLSARVFARTGRRTRAANLSGTSAVLDLEGPVPADAMGALAEDLADAVRSPRAVSIRFVPRADWDRRSSQGRSGLVPLAPQVDPVRVIEIEGLDACPCGGTHLRTTAEIGPVTLDPPSPLGDGGVRVTLRLAGPAPPTPGA